MFKGGSFPSTPQFQLDFSLSLWTKEDNKRAVITAWVGGQGCGEEKEEKGGARESPSGQGYRRGEQTVWNLQLMRDPEVRSHSKYKAVDLGQLSLEPLWMDVEAVSSDCFGILAGSRSLSLSPRMPLSQRVLSPADIIIIAITPIFSAPSTAIPYHLPMRQLL